MPRAEPAPAVPLIARDAFVAETSAQIEQLEATLRLLSRDVGRLSDKVAEIERTTEQNHRWLAFEQNEKRARQTRLEEAVRCCRDLKGRLDRMDARNGGNFHAYNSFEAVSRKFAEFDGFQDKAERMERSVVWRARLLCALVGASFMIILLSGIF